MARLAAEDGFSFNAISNSSYLKHAMARDQMKLPANPTHIRERVLSFNDNVNECIKEELGHILKGGDRFSCTTDEWTNNSGKRFMNINIHGVLNDSVRNLGLVPISGSFTAERALHTATDHLQLFGVDVQSHIVAFTADGAAVMVKFGDISPAEYQGCYSHALHLAVCDVLYKDNGSVNDNVAPENVSNENDSDGEEEDDDDCSLEIAQDGEPLVLQDNISDVIRHVRKDIKFFRKSPKSNECLQINVFNTFKKELKLILDVRTRWNSLFQMLSRYVLLRSCVVKTLIDMSKTSSVTDQDVIVCKKLCAALEPVKLASDEVCKKDANLLTADASIVFLTESLLEETNDNKNSFAERLNEAVTKRITFRRNSTIVNLLKYLKNDDIKQADQITGAKIMKTTLQAKANEMYKRLYPQTTPATPIPTVEEVGEVEVSTEERPTLQEKLRRRVEGATKESNPAFPLVSTLSLTPDFKMFEATRLRTAKLDALYRALLSIKPTSVESERAFSVGGNFCTKVRSRMSSKTLSALVSLKMHFKRQKSLQN